MFYRAISSFLLTILVLSFSACQQAPESSLPKLRIGALYTADTLPAVLAEREGWYREAGLDVEIVAFKGAEERNAAFQAGELDGMHTDIIAALLLNEKGYPLTITQITLGLEPADRTIALLAAPESDIYTLEDIKGKRVAVSRYTVMDFILDKMLAKQGIFPQDYQKVSASNISQRVQMLIDSQIDASVFPDPLSFYPESQGARLILTDTGLDVSQALIAFSDSVIASQGDLVRTFTRVTSEAMEKVNARPEDYHDFLQELIRVPKGLSYPPPHYFPNAVPKKSQIEVVSEWLQNQSIIGDQDSKDLISDAFLH